jgi:hypothetical protein
MGDVMVVTAGMALACSVIMALFLPARAERVVRPTEPISAETAG